MSVRTPIFLLVSGLLIACGGGGADESTTDARVPTADQLRAQAMLTNCGADAVDALLDTLDLFRIVPGATDLPITLGTIEGDAIPFTADIDGDLQDDLSGAITFTDDTGVPFLPLTQEQIDSGADGFLGLLTALPNGTQMRISLLPATDIGLANADLAFNFLGGLPTTIDGVVNYLADTCAVTLILNRVSPLGLLGDVPSLPAALTIQDGADFLSGTLTFNGTNIARAEVALNGGETMTLSLDLTTGDATLPGDR